MTRDSQQPHLLEPSDKNELNPVLKLPMSPVRMMTGADQAVRKMEQLDLAIVRASTIAEYLPQQLRWQTELALYDVEDRETLDVARNAVAKITTDFERLVGSIETFPEDLKQQFAESREVLGDAERVAAATQSLVERTDEALANLKAVSESLNTTATAFTETGATWDQTSQTLKALIHRERPEGAKPFDINDYTRAAEAWTQTASQILAITEQISSMQAALAETEAQTTATLNRITVRAALLIVLTLLAAIAYKAASLTLRKRSRQN